MPFSHRHALIIAASSDIGAAMGLRCCERNWRVTGTYRTEGTNVDSLRRAGADLVPCDLADNASITEACAKLSQQPAWDVLVLGPGETRPIGPFAELNFDDWERSLTVNFTAQLRIVHALLPSRNTSNGQVPTVLFFAGGGTNNATVNYSAYTVSKIALIKMCELLDAEIPDTKFVIIGPGWVRTKIHQATLEAGDRAGSSATQTVDRLQRNDFVPMDAVLDSCDWAINAARAAVSGRNFSTAFDAWRDPGLIATLTRDTSLCKLRRSGNDRVADPLEKQHD